MTSLSTFTDSLTMLAKLAKTAKRGYQIFLRGHRDLRAHRGQGFVTDTQL